MSVQIINGPTVPDAQPLFHVTMPSGVVLTRAGSFGEDTPAAVITTPPIITNSGQVIARSDPS